MWLQHPPATIHRYAAAGGGGGGDDDGYLGIGEASALASAFIPTDWDGPGAGGAVYQVAQSNNNGGGVNKKKTKASGNRNNVYDTGQGSGSLDAMYDQVAGGPGDAMYDTATMLTGGSVQGGSTYDAAAGNPLYDAGTYTGANNAVYDAAGTPLDGSGSPAYAAAGGTGTMKGAVFSSCCI